MALGFFCLIFFKNSLLEQEILHKYSNNFPQCSVLSTYSIFYLTTFTILVRLTGNLEKNNSKETQSKVQIFFILSKMY